jgi:hypothetical protein
MQLAQMIGCFVVATFPSTSEANRHDNVSTNKNCEHWSHLLARIVLVKGHHVAASDTSRTIKGKRIPIFRRNGHALQVLLIAHSLQNISAFSHAALT